MAQTRQARSPNLELQCSVTVGAMHKPLTGHTAPFDSLHRDLSISPLVWSSVAHCSQEAKPDRHGWLGLSGQCPGRAHTALQKPMSCTHRHCQGPQPHQPAFALQPGCCAGLLVWSLALMREARGVAAAAVYAVLVNMKHLFLCLAPLYLVYLLSHDCRRAGPGLAARGCGLAGRLARPGAQGSTA